MRGARGCREPAAAQRRGGRRLGRGLRAAGRRRTRAGLPVPLPRSPHRGHGCPRARTRSTGRAVRRHRHPDDADQHGLPAARRRGLARPRGRRARRARARPVRALAERRVRQRGHSRVDHRFAGRSRGDLGAAADRSARAAGRSVRRRPGRGRDDARRAAAPPRRGRRARARRRRSRHGRGVRGRAAALAARRRAVLGDLVAARARARRARPHRRGGGVQPDQRARRGRDDPAAAQRDGPVAGAGVQAALGHGLRRAASPRRRGRGRRPAVRSGRRGVPHLHRHARADRGRLRRERAAGAAL